MKPFSFFFTKLSNGLKANYDIRFSTGEKIVKDQIIQPPYPDTLHAFFKDEPEVMFSEEDSGYYIYGQGQGI